MSEIYTSVLDGDFNDEIVQELFEQKDWMKHKKFTLVKSLDELEKFVDDAIAVGAAAIDLETTGLNSRVDENGEPKDIIVGLCLSHNSYEGFYVPLAHDDKEANLPTVHAMEHIKRLVNNAVTIYHNYKFDGEFLRHHGIIIEDANMYQDTLLLAYALDHGLKLKGLKHLSKLRLNQEMIEIGELMADKSEVHFASVDPEVAVYYGGSDAICTFGLWESLSKELEERDPQKKNGLNNIYMIEKRCQFVVMEMERNMPVCDIEYYKETRITLTNQLEAAQKELYRAAGRSFDVMSPQQVGVILFDEQKIPYPSDMARNASGGYLTNKGVLDSLRGHKIVDLLLKYREIKKVLATYVENLIANSDANNRIKFKLNQSAADTGRFSASGGYGLDKDGYCGVNCQNIPSNYSEDAVDIRKGIKASPGYVFCAIDYSGEELRIATNLSGEKRWKDEFLYGSGDLHTITGKIVTGKQKLSKVERGLGKTVNFLTLYGGGANKLAAQANISVEDAQQALYNFFKELPGLSDWIKSEMRRSKKRGYAITALGRRRPLKDLYDSGDKKKIAQADRNSVNSAIQGTGADILKIALYKCWRYIRDNNLEDIVRIIYPVHDEIVFEIRQDRLNDIVPAVSEVMKLDSLLKGKLGWEVGLDVDAEYSTSFHVKWDFYKLKTGEQCYCCGREIEREPNGKIRLCTREDAKKETDTVCDGMTDAEVLASYDDDKPFSILHLLDGSNVELQEVASTTFEKKIVSPKQILQGETGTAVTPSGSTGTTNDINPEPVNTPEESSPIKSMSFDDKPENKKSEGKEPEEKRDSIFFDHIVTKDDEIARCQANLIWAVLDSQPMRKFGTGEKKRIRLLSPKNEVLFTTPQKYHIDGFIALALNYEI